jgi:copper oxidase (laccase) domain-containing protein
LLREVSHGHNSRAETSAIRRNDSGNTWAIDLRQIVFSQLLQAGIPPEGIAVSGECTFGNPEDFFSHRRATLAPEETGRMAALLGLKE